MKYDALIFDVDGVLIDTNNSFTSAVVEAVAFDCGSSRFTSENVAQLKETRGFNNDWHVAIAGNCWLHFAPELSFETFVNQISGLGGGMNGLRAFVPDLTPELEQRVTHLAQEAYGGTSACKKLYGFEPEFIRNVGYWQTERPLITPDQAKKVISITGLVTGRNLAELELAFEILGWRPPIDVIAYSDNPALDKPNPEKLTTIIKNLCSSQPLFVGDSRDDLELVKNYRKATGQPIDFCLIHNETSPWEYDLHFPSINELFNYLGVQNG